MDQNIKSLWIEALRSGEYEQGKQYLYADGKWCCLGVLFKLQGREMEKEPFAVRMYPEQYAGLSLSQTWVLAGMNDGVLNQISIQDAINHYDLPTPIYPEDKSKRYSFLEIADFIEEKL